MKIIELTPYTYTPGGIVSGKIRIKAEYITAYFKEEEVVFLDAKQTDKKYRTIVFVLDKLSFYVQETPEEIDKLLKED